MSNSAPISSSSTPYSYAELPPDVLNVIFLNHTFTLIDLPFLGAVCTSWKKVIDNAQALHRFASLLKSLHLIPQELNENQNLWPVLKENYYPHCDVLVDVTRSMFMIASFNNAMQFETSPRLVAKIEAVVTTLLQFGTKVTLSTYMDDTVTSLPFPGKSKVADAFLKKYSLFSHTQLPNILKSKLSLHCTPIPCPKKKLIIVISDLQFHYRMSEGLLQQISRINSIVTANKNIFVVFMELYATCRHGFKTELKDFLKKQPAISYVRLIEEKKIEQTKS